MAIANPAAPPPHWPGVPVGPVTIVPTPPVHSPEWWVARLNKRLDERRPDIERYDAYYRGDHPLPAAPKKAQEAYLRLIQQSRSNWMGLVVDAVAERLRVEGFRYGKDASADDHAWKIWQANGLDVASESVHLEALISGTSAVTISPDPENARIPLILPEHPSQVIVASDPGAYRHRLAAFKKWRDDSGYLFAVLYLPDAIYKLRSVHTVKVATDAGNIEWTRREVAGEQWPMPNPLGEVPVIPFCNQPRMMVGGVSELSDLTDIQDRINKTLFDRLLAAEYTAFRQRWVVGQEIKYDPVTGQPVDQFDSSVSRLMQAENPDVKFGEFSETNLAGYIDSVESDVQHLAAISRTPPHYLLGQSGAFPSGESLKATETGLVAKVTRRSLHFGESWEDTMRLAFKAIGSPRAKVTNAETIWRNPESRTLAELTDALIKMQALGVPNEALWAEWGASPQKIEQWKALAATAPPPPPAATPPVAPGDGPTPLPNAATA